MHRAAVLVVLALGAAGGLGRSLGTSWPESRAAAERVTFTRDVAPIVFTHCAPCHHDGGAGPFPLLSYADVRRRARQIVKVTGARVMPPWPPVEGHGTFKGERRLESGADRDAGAMGRRRRRRRRRGGSARSAGVRGRMAARPSGSGPHARSRLDAARRGRRRVPQLRPARAADPTTIRARDRDPSGQRPYPPSRQRAPGSQRRGPPA